MNSSESGREHLDHIPVIDLGALRHEKSSGYFKLVEEFRRVFSTVGFTLIINHGIEPSLVDSLFEAFRRFHELSLEQKMEVELNHLHRGYIPINTSTDVNSRYEKVKYPNQSSSFMMMRED